MFSTNCTRITILLLTLLMALPLEATDWYVRPKTWTPDGASNGQSYVTAWDGVAAIVWGDGGVTAGDTLYLCGTFTRTSESNITTLLTVGASGTTGSPIVIRGDCEDEAGALYAARVILAASWTDNEDDSFYYDTTLATSGAFEGTPGGTELLLEPAGSQADCNATDGSYWYDDVNDLQWYNPHGASARDVWFNWTSPIYLNGQSYVTIRNLTLACASTSGSWVKMIAGEDNVIIDSCTFRYATGRGLWHAGGCDALTITNNHFSEFTTAIYVVGTTGAPDGVRIAGNEFDGGEASYNSWWFTSYPSTDRGAILAEGAGENWVIEKNYIHDVGHHGIFLYQDPSVSARDMLVRYNWIENINDSTATGRNRGIVIGGTNTAGYSDRWGGLKIANNVIVNCGDVLTVEGQRTGAGIFLKCGVPTDLGDRMQIVGNTISGCFHSFVAFQAVAGEQGYGVVIQNNISYRPQSTGYHLYFYNVTTRDNALVSHNCFYPDTSEGDNLFAWNLVDVADYAAWAAAAGADGSTVENDILTDPLFVSVDANDFSLAAGSSCRGVGTAVDTYGLSKLTDWTARKIVLKTQPNPPDMGAYVYHTTKYLLGRTP